VLDNRHPVSHTASRRDVVDSKANEIAAAQLAIDGEIEQRQIALAVLHLKPDTNGPDLFRPKGTLLTNETSFVPCDPRRNAVCLDFSGHGRPRWPNRSHRSACIQQAGYRSATAPSCGDLSR